MNNKTIELNNILKNSERERIKLKHPYVGSEHLFLSLLKYRNSLSIFLKEYSITYDSFKKNLVQVVGECRTSNPANLYTPLLRKILARYEIKKNNKNYLQKPEENLFLAILDEGEGIAIRILLRMNIDLDEIYIRLKKDFNLQ